MSFLEKVQVTQLFRDTLNDGEFTADELAQYFSEWKAMGEFGVHRDYYFGKDGFYDKPRSGGRRVLRHVHFAPGAPAPNEHPSEAYLKWELQWKHGGRKTSDTSLIYAHDPGHGYLLIYMAREPEGHQIARMDTAETRDFMHNLVFAADRFIFNGEILI